MEEHAKYALENVDWIETGVKYALGLIGIFVFSLWKIKDHLGSFDFGKLMSENKFFWIWSYIMVSVVLSILTISPETSGALKSLTGLDVSNEPASFLMLGWSLSALANSAVKKKLDKKAS